MDFIEALSRRYQGEGVLGSIGSTFSIPAHLITSGIAEGDYLQNFARGIDPSELILSRDASGIAKLGVDIVADPLNLLMGAGLISKLAKAGKISKAIKSGDTIADLTKGVEAAEHVAGDVVSKIGRSQLWKKSEALQKYAIENADWIAVKRGKNLVHDDIMEAAGKAGDDLDKAFVLDMELNTGGAVRKQVNVNKLLTTPIDKFKNDLLKKQRIKPLENITGLKAGAGRDLEYDKAINRQLLKKLNEVLGGMTKEERKLAGATLKKIGGNEYTPAFMDKVVEWATMSKLWGLSTMVRNTVGNTFSAMLQVPEKFIAGAVDAVKHGITGAPRAVYMREALEETIGITGALKDAGSNFWRIMKDPTAYIEEATKLGEVIGKHGAIGGLTGEIIRAPGRVLTATDVAFRTALRGGNIRGLATRHFLNEGLRGQELAVEVAKVVTKKNKKLYDEIFKTAEKGARERIFQETLTGFVKTLDDARMKHPWARLIVPFFKTPVNLLKQSLQRVPGGPLAMPSFWKTLRNPHLSKLSKTEFYETMIARQVTGSLFLGGAFMAASEGKVSGIGPRSTAKRNAMRLSGWQPQSVKVGDKWYSYRGFEPISSWFRAAADAFEGHKEGENPEELSMKLVFSYMKQFSENPFLMGVHDIYEGISSPETKASDLLTGMAIGSTVPNIVQQWNRTMIDPVIRQPKTIPEKVFSRLPLLSQTVGSRRDIFGESIVRDDAWKSLFGFNVSMTEKDKTFTELARLEMGVGKPSKNINGIELTDEEYDRFYVLKGMMLKESISKMVHYKQYDQLPDETKKKIISKIIRDVNKTAKSEIFVKYYGGKR